MRVLVTAAALVITPGVELRLTPEEAKLRKFCMTPVGGGVFRATLENHYKSGAIVEFAGDVPKQYTTSVTPVDEHGKVLLPQSPAPAPAPAAPAAKADDAHLGDMTKAELLDLAEQRGVTVDTAWNKAQIVSALRKKKAA